jgi:hypothetical protein
MRLKVFIVALLLVAPDVPARAATYYVSPSGSDSNAGTQAAPWRTLQKAGDVARADDDVVVTPGTYQGFRPRNSGTLAAPVRFLAQPGVIVTSPGPANANSDNIWVRDVDYVVIDGFESRNAPRAGVAVQGEPDANAIGITIRNCFCHDNGRWGIFTGFARDLLIEHNETSYSAAEHGIYVSNSGDRPIVRRNHVHHNRASGIQLNADPAQQGPDPTDPGGDGIITDALVEANVIHDNGAAGGAAINLASVRTSLFRDNLLYNNHASGIAGWDDGNGTEWGTQENDFVGNTIVQASDGRFAIGLINGSVNNTVLNNILLHPGTRGSLNVDPGSLPGLVSDYNIVVNRFSDDDLFYDLATWRAMTGLEAHSVIATASALFADAAANDFHLALSSPAIDAGTFLDNLPRDLDGDPRPQGASFDIGADEIASNTSPPPSTTPRPSATRTPTPSATQTATLRPSATRTVTRRSTVTRTPTVTQRNTATPTRTLTRRPTLTRTPTATRTRTRRPTLTPTRTSTRRPTVTPTRSFTRRPTITRTPTATRRPTRTPTA